MTPMKEDYLKIIFELGGGRKKVSNKEIPGARNRCRVRDRNDHQVGR